MHRHLFATIVLCSTACSAGRDAPVLPAGYALRGFWADPGAITYRVEGGGGPLDEKTLERAFERACAAWSAAGAAGRTRVGFRAALPDEEPDVVLSWQRRAHGPCPPFGTDTSVAHSGPVGHGTFIHLDAGRTWTTGEGAGVSLDQTLLHELGHVLGIDHGSDPGSLLYSDPVAKEITRSDRDALWTLYGGPAPGPSDVVVSHGDGRVAVVYGVATPGRSELALFDTEGDGKDELLVWRTDAEGQGELVVIHFAPGPRAERTVGPRVGVVDSTGDVYLVATPDGERLLVISYPNGNRIVRAFDRRGILQAREGEPPPLRGRPEYRREGDLDGDGVPERVARGPSD